MYHLEAEEAHPNNSNNTHNGNFVWSSVKFWIDEKNSTPQAIKDRKNVVCDSYEYYLKFKIILKPYYIKLHKFKYSKIERRRDFRFVDLFGISGGGKVTIEYCYKSNIVTNRILLQIE